MRDHSDGPNDAADFDGPSKTQLKREVHELQDLGVALLALPAARRAAIEMDERLREALGEHARMPTREAKRRHLQYIGKLLRDTETGPVRRALEAFHSGDARALHEAERWRERLLASDDALGDWIKTHPDGEVQPLRALIRKARREQAEAEAADRDSGKAVGKGRAYRELFQMLRAHLQAAVEAGVRPAGPGD